MKILFICTHNRCRSILSEAITNHLADGRITAYSAGSQPAGEVHPLSLKYLQQRGISIDGLQSQSWDDFEAIKPDVVITVCDSAANEACPVWFGNTAKVHWGLPDPTKLEGSEAEIQSAFNSVMDTIEIRVRGLLSLDIAAMSGAQLQTTLQQLAEEI
ncbi:MAG: arsenate reductase ArsC [Zhongshania sp.]|uniref:arsenate reductase ArsC n=1 Tax=Zhongshania sp. TaxID=1971902 RepID=UPI002607522F|nr:arsenate reductase ArsC [Zhongshania sp.]MDF1693444.1 arsenate reductase ArsC [Zhongshania sp.]